MDIRIPDVMYAHQVDRDRGSGVAPESTAPDFSRTFVDNIDAIGRSYEMGLVARHYLRHYPLRLPGLAPMGLAMVTKGRMGFVPHRIHGVDRPARDPGPRAELEEAG